MRIGATFICLVLVAAACGDDSNSAAGSDLSVDAAAPGDAGAGGKIGAACKTSGDCSGGAHPACWVHNAFNSTSYVAMPDGYCSSKCEAASDCTADSRCVDFGPAGKWCVALCNTDGDCRASGVNDAGMGAATSPYACWLDGLCWVTSVFTCDPTAGDGTCATAGPNKNQPGGCKREANGLGQRGFCDAFCTVGSGTCAALADGTLESCQITDERFGLDGKATGDKFVGPVCTFLQTTCVTDGDCLPGAKCMGAQGSTLGMCVPSPLHPTGQECTYGTAGHFTNVCVDGDECFLKGAAPAGMGFSPSGDNDCHLLCYLPGGGPVMSTVDMGAPLGTPAGGQQVHRRVGPRRPCVSSTGATTSTSRAGSPG